MWFNDETEPEFHSTLLVQPFFCSLTLLLIFKSKRLFRPSITSPVIQKVELVFIVLLSPQLPLQLGVKVCEIFYNKLFCTVYVEHRLFYLSPVLAEDLKENCLE